MLGHITFMSTVPLKTKATFRQHWTTLPSWVGMAAVAIVAALLYIKAVNFGFWFDDPSLHLRVAAEHTFLQLALPLATWDHYRPLALLLTRALYLVWGLDAHVYHTLPIMLNALNAALLFLFARRWSKSSLIAWCGAFIFVFFPFTSHLAVHFATIFHELLLCFALLFMLA
ncbi:MAG: hypothetical protein ACYC6L_03995, partial [Anaerolineae bacterium]